MTVQHVEKMTRTIVVPKVLVDMIHGLIIYLQKPNSSEILPLLVSMWTLTETVLHCSSKNSISAYLDGGKEF